MCHNSVGSTETRRWSDEIDVRTPQSALPVANSNHDQRVENRGTSWDNTPVKDDEALEGRGTAWDNALGQDKGTSLGPKFGTSGGKPQPLYGNTWEQGRFSRRAFAPRYVRRRRLQRGL